MSHVKAGGSSKNVHNNAGARLGVKRWGGQKVSAGAAVSYTHLRAHETVLDLVCRLLLEKKTNTTPSQLHPPFIHSTYNYNTYCTQYNTRTAYLASP